MSKRLYTLLEKLDPKGEIFTEDVKKELVGILNEKMQAVYQKAYDNVSDKLDEKHAKQLETMLEQVDKVHAMKLRNMIVAIDKRNKIQSKNQLNQIDRDHTAKLSEVKSFYESKLVDKVDKYLDVYLEEVMPKDVIIDHEKLANFEKVFATLRESLMISDDYIQKEVKEAVLDAKQQLDEKSKEIDKLMFEKTELMAKIKANEVEKLLESKTEGMPESQKLYMKKLFENADAKEISEKFDEAAKALKKENNKRRELLESEAKSKTEAALIEESREIVTENKTDDPMNFYANRITRSYGLKS